MSDQPGPSEQLSSSEWVEAEEEASAASTTPAAPNARQEPDTPAQSVGKAATPTAANDIGVEPPIRYRYKIVMHLPPDIQAAVDAAREAAKLPVEKVNNNLEWQVNFHTNFIQQVESKLGEWTKDHLPIETKLIRVFSEVKGRQTYVAGWLLENTAKLQEGRRHLVAALASLITVEPTANTNFQARLALAHDTPADKFPTLVAHLQQHFKETAWKMTQCTLYRQEIDGAGKPVPAKTWEVARQYNKET